MMSSRLHGDRWRLTAGMCAQVSEATGCAILPDTAAYLECSVASRCGHPHMHARACHLSLTLTHAGCACLPAMPCLKSK